MLPDERMVEAAANAYEDLFGSPHDRLGFQRDVLSAAFAALDRDALIEDTARRANPAYDAATHDETRAHWRHEAERYLQAAGLIA